MDQNVERITRCRFCERSQLKTFLTLRPMPKPNAFLVDVTEHEEYFPLAVCRCLDCGLVQLTHMVNPEAMFSHYVYASAMSQTMMQHFDDASLNLIKYISKPDSALVMDIGSNDGSFLRYFQNHGTRVLGVDPAVNIAEKASADGIPTHVDFFSAQSAETLARKYGQADLIVGTNVFAHIDDLGDVFKGINICLKPGGVMMMEFPYFVDLLENNEFDTMYHEHRYYFLIKPLSRLLSQHGLEIFDCKHFKIHGGTLRLYVQRQTDHKYPIAAAVGQLVTEEERKGMYVQKTYDDFAGRVYTIRDDLLKLLHDLKSQGKKIVGYGASAKGNVLLNFCQIGPAVLDYIVDNTPYKQGFYTPGVHIPVVSEDRLFQDKPDYALMLIWNFKDEVLQKQKAFRDQGGKFIIPIPAIEII